MTNIEQQFFKTFGIKPKYQDACTVEDKYWQNEELANKYGTFDMYMNAKCGNQENCTTQCSCAYTKEIYPEITDRILLQLIVIVTNYVNDICEMTDVEDLKKSTLEELIEISDRGTVKYQVQSLLFREGEE